MVTISPKELEAIKETLIWDHVWCPGVLTINFEVNSHCAWLMKVISFFPTMDQIWDQAIKKGKDQVVIWLQL